jgi:hypothetical protein
MSRVSSVLEAVSGAGAVKSNSRSEPMRARLQRAAEAQQGRPVASAGALREYL